MYTWDHLDLVTNDAATHEPMNCSAGQGLVGVGGGVALEMVSSIYKLEWRAAKGEARSSWQCAKFTHVKGSIS